MPFFDFIFEKNDYIANAEPESTLIGIIRDDVKLLSLGTDGKYAPYPYGRYNDAAIVTRNWAPLGLENIFGFQVGGYCPEGTGIKFQCSPDDGVTWYWFDGFDWLVATTEMSTEEQIDAGISTFPFQGSLKIRMRLETDVNGECTPIVRFLRIYCKYRDFSATDDSFRSLMDFFFANGTYLQPHLEDLISQSTILLPTRFTIAQNPKVFVYNLDNDPKKRDNLFSSINNNEVTLISVQSGRVLVEFEAQPSFHIQTDAEIQISQLPSVTIQMLSARHEDATTREKVYDYARSLKVAYVSEWPSRWRYRFELKAMTHLKCPAGVIADKLRKALEKFQYVRSIFYDEMMYMYPPSQVVSQEDRPVENLYVQRFEFEARWLDWCTQEEPEEVPLVEEVNVNLWPNYRNGFTKETIVVREE